MEVEEVLARAGRLARKAGLGSVTEAHVVLVLCTQLARGRFFEPGVTDMIDALVARNDPARFESDVAPIRRLHAAASLAAASIVEVT